MTNRITLPRLYCIVDAGGFAGEPDPTAAILNFTRELMRGGARLIQYRNKVDGAGVMLAQARAVVASCQLPVARESETQEEFRVSSFEFRAKAQEKQVPRYARDDNKKKFRVSSFEFRAKAQEKQVPRYARDDKQESQRPTANGQRLILIFNDRSDLALGAAFGGVHLGQEDLSPGAARRLLGAGAIIGLSTHNPEQVATADGEPVDYLAVGPVFATASKQHPDPVIGLAGVRRARELTRKPLVAIGGITRANCQAVIEAGADAVAVINDLLADPRRAVEEFLAVLDAGVAG